MKPVKQQIVDQGRGDCMRATVASLLELEIEAVPHFILHGTRWHNIFVSFLEACGWNWEGLMNYSETGPNILKKEDSIDGYFYTVVPSKNFENTWHAVVMDMNGVIVHDPSPREGYVNENVLETGSIVAWHRFSKKK